MELNRLRELAGVPLMEMKTTSRKDPLVTIWDKETSNDKEGAEGIVGHMHLSTADQIYNFGDSTLANRLHDAGVDKRLKAGSKWLAMSKWTDKEIKQQIHKAYAKSAGDEKTVDILVKKFPELSKTEITKFLDEGTFSDEDMQLGDKVVYVLEQSKAAIEDLIGRQSSHFDGEDQEEFTPLLKSLEQLITAMDE